MSIEIVCSQCGAVHHVNDRLAGRRVRCSACEAPVTVPVPPVATDPLESETSASDSAAMRDELTAPNRIQDRASAAAFLKPDGFPTSSNGDLLSEHNATAVAVEDEDDDAIPLSIKGDDSELDMTPMVDVTFLLLIFFMITAAFSLQKSIESPRQQSDKPSSAQQQEDPDEIDIVTVQINEYGAYLVMAPDWERETPGKQNLIHALRDARGDGSNPIKLDIQVHEMAKLQSLVDCMDAGSICSYGEVQVTQVDGFD